MHVRVAAGPGAVAHVAVDAELERLRLRASGQRVELCVELLDLCHLLAAQHRDVIAYGAGWTNPDRQQPVGDTGRREPRQVDAIVDAELQRALDDPDPLRGIAQLVARFAAAFVLDPGGVTRTKTLGTERMGRKLHNGSMRRPRLRTGSIPGRLGTTRTRRIRMSLVVRFTPPGPATTEQYDETIRRLQETGDFPPEGLEYHVCYLASDGNVRVGEVWDSQEQLDAFGERLTPVLADVGVDPGEPEIREIHNIIRR